MMKIILLFMFLHASLPSQAEQPEPLRLAVASNFMTTAKQLVLAFEAQTDIQISLSSGSTGKLTTQIRHGAPYDIFLAADTHHPRQLIMEGLALETTLQNYATGQLVLISRVELARPEALKYSQSRLQIATANAEIAPYGKAARAWLTQHVPNLNNHQLVTGENINQTWHFFVNGGADIALVALSQVLLQQPESSRYWLLASSDESLIQSAVILSRSQQRERANKFLDYLQSKPALSIIEKSGYLPPTVYDSAK